MIRECKTCRISFFFKLKIDRTILCTSNPDPYELLLIRMSMYC